MLSGSSLAIRRWAVAVGVLLGSGCSLLLGGDRSYYEVDAHGSGGAGGGATTASSTDVSSASSTGGGASGGGGPGASTSSASSSTGTGGAVNDTCWHGEPADPGGVDPCGPTTVGVLADNFNDNMIGPLWGVYQISASAQEVNHQVEIAVPGAPGKFAGFVSASAYSLLGCHGSIAVLQSPQHPSTITHLSFSPDPSAGTDLVEVHQVDKSIRFVMVVAGLTTQACEIPYLPVAHRYWRVREKGGDLLWETSPGGVTWTVQRREKTPPFVASVRVDFGVIPVAADLAGTGIFDDFDLP